MCVRTVGSDEMADPRCCRTDRGAAGDPWRGAFGGYFYWDDLILIGRAGTQGLLSPGYLFDDHDGHVMPGAFLVAGGPSPGWHRSTGPCPH